MIFRSGSILIVSNTKCNEFVLKIVYEYIKNILLTEILRYIKGSNLFKRNQKLKIKKKFIILMMILYQ